MIRKFILITALVFAFASDAADSPEGWVKMTFDIDRKGHPVNILVVDSNPKGYFDEEAVRALKSWKYKPQIVDGTPVVQKGREVKLESES